MHLPVQYEALYLNIKRLICSTAQYLIKPQCMSEGYCSRSVCVSVCYHASYYTYLIIR